MRIAIVNDLALAREALRRAVVSVPGQEVAWMAVDGGDALAKTLKDRPDMILMDLIMPVMDGVEATRQIMKQAPCPIVVVTSSVSGNIGRVYEAMSLGALDAVDTPALGSGGKLDGAEPLLRKINNLSRIARRSSTTTVPRSTQTATTTKPPTPGTPARTSRPTPTPGVKRKPLVLIGASTGGPKVLAEILTGLKDAGDFGIVIVQHVDEAFAPGLARWLADQSGLNVETARPGQSPRAGLVLVAHTNDHLCFTRERTLAYTAEPLAECYRPSVDVLFQSALRHWPDPGVAVLLTGMGRDGAVGLSALKGAGWYTIAQDKETSTVWGMPRAAVELNAARAVLPTPRIAPAIRAELAPLAAS